MKKEIPENLRALTMINVALDLIGLEIERLAKDSLQDRSLIELEKIHQSVLSMKEDLESGSPSGEFFGVGRMIADSWPYDFDLGEKILAAEQAYRSVLMKNF